MCDRRIVKKEKYDADMMEGLLRDETIPTLYRKRLSDYKKHHLLSTNCVEVVYHYGKGCEENQLGRLYAKNNKGLQSFPKDIRNPLLQKYYYDLDFENAHFKLMVKLGKDWNLIIRNIEYYCDNRDACLNMVSSDRKTAKTAYLKVAYGGNIKLHNEHIDNEIEIDGNDELLKKIEIEVKVMMDVCYANNEQYHNLVKNKPNKKASLFALILQTEECKCLLLLDEFLKSKGRQADILMFDGLNVLKQLNEIEFPKNLLVEAENYIYEKSGYKMKITEKAIENNYEIKEIENINDLNAAKKFVLLMGDNMINHNGEIFYFNENTGMWENTTDAFITNIIKHHNKLIFLNKATNRYIDYGGIGRNTDQMKRYFTSLISDTKFMSDRQDSSIGKLLFADGIYDFNTDTFTKGFNKEIIFFKRINRNFPTERNEELISELNKVLFVNAFDIDNNKEAGEYLKKSLCLAIYGEYTDKKVHFATGLSNCGKGVLVCALRSCFEGYVSEFDANNLQYNKNYGSDEGKRMAWLKDLQNVRLAFSSEVRIIKGKSTGIDGNLLKKLSSGGDANKIRGNYENEYEMVNKSSIFIMCNDVPNIEPPDEAVCDRLYFIRYMLRFVKNPVEENERYGDENIKKKLKQNDYINALFFLFKDTYKDILSNGVIVPNCVLAEKSNWIVDENTLFKQYILEKFEITNNPEDKVECNKICFYLNQKGLNWSETKIGLAIKKMISLENSSFRSKSIRYKLGIKLLDDNVF